MYLSILMLMNPWVILNLWLLWKGLLWTFIYIYFSEHIYTFLSHVYLRMEMLSHNIWIFRFWKCWQFPRVFVLSYTPSSHIWEFSFLQGSERLFSMMSLFPLISACTQDSISWFMCFLHSLAKYKQNILQYFVIWHLPLDLLS